MVTKWGLTEKLGPLTYAEDEDEVFLGRSVTQHKHVSDDTARLIDMEVREIIDVAHGKAKALIEENLTRLHVMADALMKYETINGSQIDQIMEGHEPDPPEGWQDSDGEPEVKSSADDITDAPDRTSVGGPAEQV
jgi:cell division protease FtsH